jgi:Flp pilus assembly protein TadG
MNRRDDDGVVAVLVALLSVVLMIVGAFTVDVGFAYAQRLALQTGADSAATAIVRSEQRKVLLSPTTTCAQLRDNDGAAASAIALNQINSNSVYGDAPTSSQVTATLSCTGSNGGILQAVVSVTYPVKSILGGFAGFSGYTLNRQATAVLGAVNGVSGFLPIALCTNQAQAVINDATVDVPARSTTYRHELVNLNKVWPTGTPCANGGAGNWGWLDCQGNSANSIADGIQNGCPETITLTSSTNPPSFTASGTPGDKLNAGPVDQAMATVMDKIRVVPVYNSVTSNGNNATYTIIGFLSVRLCGNEANHKTNTGACYVTTDPLAVTASNPSGNVALVSNSLQIQYVDYTPVADISTLCGLGTVTCQYNVTATQLVR